MQMGRGPHLKTQGQVPTEMNDHESQRERSVAWRIEGR